MNVWNLYDILIDKIPKNIYANDVIIGDDMCGILYGENLGVAMNYTSGIKPCYKRDEYVNLSLHELATLSKSWNFTEASIGMSAINSFFNTNLLSKTKYSVSFLDAYKNKIQGKKVAVIGHFPYIETTFKDICDVFIIERLNIENDYPDTACEFILHDRDVIFITGSSFVNKSIKRLLELCKNKEVILVGPTTPMCTELYSHGISGLSGFIITEPYKAIKSLYDSSMNSIFQYGKMINLDRN